jgi:hypothetical protein
MTRNIVPCCSAHHRKFHREKDNPAWSLDEFIEEMESIGYGRGIYAIDAANKSAGGRGERNNERQHRSTSGVARRGTQLVGKFHPSAESIVTTTTSGHSGQGE